MVDILLTCPTGQAKKQLVQLCISANCIYKIVFQPIVFQLRLNLVFDVNSQQLPTKLQVQVKLHFKIDLI